MSILWLFCDIQFNKATERALVAVSILKLYVAVMHYVPTSGGTVGYVKLAITGILVLMIVDVFLWRIR